MFTRNKRLAMRLKQAMFKNNASKFISEYKETNVPWNKDLKFYEMGTTKF